MNEHRDTDPCPAPEGAVHVFAQPDGPLPADARYCDGVALRAPADGVDVVYHREHQMCSDGALVCLVCGEIATGATIPGDA